MSMTIAVAVAVATFAVLSSSTEVSRLDVVGTVESRGRGAYEVLVRAQGGRQANLESGRGLVSAQAAGPQAGGISVPQWELIRGVPGVEVAAPVGHLGYVSVPILMNVDVTEAVDRSQRRQWIRVIPSWTADRGLSHIPSEAYGLLYVTSDTVAWPDRSQDRSVRLMRYSDGRMRPLGLCDDPTITVVGQFWPVEIRADGTEHPICWRPATSVPWLGVAQLADGGFVLEGRPSERATLAIFTTMWLPVAAVDPGSEARLTGLDQSVVSGDYVRVGASARRDTASGARVVPALVASDPSIQEELWARVERLDISDSAADMRGTRFQGRVAGATVEAGLTSAYVGDPGHFYQATLAVGRTAVIDPIRFSDPEYGVGAEEALRPDVIDVDPDSLSGRLAFQYRTPAAADTAFRLATGYTFRASVSPDVRETFAVEVVGVFRRSDLVRWDSTARLPWDAFDVAGLQGADQRTRDLLGGQRLLPSSNPGGYVSSAPALLLSLPDAARLAWNKDFISAVRVRVIDGQGIDEASWERVRLVADEIAARTGLRVDVVAGSSPAPQVIELAAGRFGRPELRLAELWTKKNVATTILKAVERKSLVLFVLVLLVCALFVANAAAATVRQRRSELGVLACVGWGRRPLFEAVLGELLAIGAAAGVLGSVGAWLTGRQLDLDLSTGQALLAAPAALVVTMLAGVLPAWRASRADPMESVRPAVTSGRRARLWLGAASLATANVFRAPGRSLLGVAAMIVATAAVTLLAAVMVAFRGAVVGSLLGDLVSVQVRGADLVAGAAMLVLAAVAVGDVVYLNIVDRAAEFATLQATGWTDRAVSSLVLAEAAILGAVGSLAGATLGGTAAWVLADGRGSGLMIGISGAVAAGGVVLSLGAAVVPIALMRRHPTLRLLTEE